jgi:hypothetical protein
LVGVKVANSENMLVQWKAAKKEVEMVEMKVALLDNSKVVKKVCR